MNRKIALLSTAAVAAMTTAAYAHPGHTVIDFSGGIRHPFTGIDHMAAMIAVGLWAAQLGKRATWTVPLAFIVMMLVGALLSFAHVQIPFAEQGIAASIFVLGLLIVFTLRMNTTAGTLLVGAFAIFHGWAHASEMAAGSSALSYGSGFLLSTALLHIVGLVLGLTLIHFKAKPIIRFAGLALILCSALLITGIL